VAAIRGVRMNMQTFVDKYGNKAVVRAAEENPNMLDKEWDANH